MTKDDYGNKILASNVALTAKAVAAVRTFGCEPATPAEARAILGIKPFVR